MSGKADESSAVTSACGSEKSAAKPTRAHSPKPGPPYAISCSEPSGPPLTLKKTTASTANVPSLGDAPAPLVRVRRLCGLGRCEKMDSAISESDETRRGGCGGGASSSSGSAGVRESMSMRRLERPQRHKEQLAGACVRQGCDA